MTGKRSQLINFVSKFLGTVRFGNDQVARLMGYGDYQIGNVIISRVYYVEGLGHNLFLAGQFFDSDLEVAFQKHTCFIRNLEGANLLTGSSDINLYTLSLNDMLKSSPICLLSKASKTKSWLWHRRLSHLNFGTINELAKQGMVRGLPKLTYVKVHLCSACSLGKSKKHTLKPKYEDSIQEKLYLLHMDLCVLIRIESINGKKYILVIVDDYSREDLGKLKPKDDIGIFIGYSPAKKAYQIYNRRTRLIMETIHVNFDELTVMAFEQFGSGPELQLMTPGTITADTTSTPLLTSIDQDAPSASTSSTTQETQSPIIQEGVEEQLQPAKFDDDPFQNVLTTEQSSEESSSNVHLANPPVEHISKWTKNHPLNNVIGNPSRPFLTRSQLQIEALWCYFDAFLSLVEPKNYKEAPIESSWIEAMQEEIHEFERLQVWELVPRPDYIMLIHLKWIFKIKLDEFGGVLKNKARLVAKGFR
ncbi:retrovirus-related pol polyprotein from transposon TNT 1-94 [Tanacetum coccineum]